jgi:hypothetical protein
MSNNASIYAQHTENTEWLNKLNFYKDEIRILTGRLEEISTKYTSQEVLAEVERFQNQWIIQRNNIDEIAHKIKENEQSLIDEINNNPVAVDHRKMEYHTEEQQLVEGFEQNFNSIRDEFNRFASKWM